MICPGEDERERGVTVDVATRQFETSERRITLLDAPGHRDFIPSMITGAAQADVAMLVVAAAANEFEAGMSERGQTREHALLVHALGVTDLIVVVNKMDMVAYDEARFDEVKREVGEHLRRVGFSPDSVRYVPVSGLAGDNLCAPRASSGASSGAAANGGSETSPMAKWWRGPSLEGAINAFAPRVRDYAASMRMVINDRYERSGKGDVVVVGRLDAGTVQVRTRCLAGASGAEFRCARSSQPLAHSARLALRSSGACSVRQLTALPAPYAPPSLFSPDRRHACPDAVQRDVHGEEGGARWRGCRGRHCRR